MMRHFGLDQCKQIKVYYTEEISIRLQLHRAEANNALQPDSTCIVIQIILPQQNDKEVSSIKRYANAAAESFRKPLS